MLYLCLLKVGTAQKYISLGEVNIFVSINGGSNYIAMLVSPYAAMQTSFKILKIYISYGTFNNSFNVFIKM